MYYSGSTTASCLQRRLRHYLAGSLGLLAASAVGLTAQSSQAAISSVRIISGLSRPLFVTAPPGDTTRIFVVEQRGVPTATQARILVYNNTVFPPTLIGTFLTISGVSTGNEQGLLGMAFDPNYSSNRRFYVNYTTAGVTRISRFTASIANPNVADTTEEILLSFGQPESNHNGGWIGFGPDNYLYIATGDGGGANDQHTQNCATGNGQCLTTLLGKILRINVSGVSGYTVPSTNPFPGATAPFNTIWAYGLRNPFRCAFDRMTGQLYIGDVGQNAVEEIDIQPADVNGNMGGRNYGWRCMEGGSCTGLSGCTCGAASLVAPVHTYGHTLGRNCIIGGYVYRGSNIPEIYGHYIFADNGTSAGNNQFYSFQYTGTNNPPVTDRSSQLGPGGGTPVGSVTSFGEDAAGEMYITDLGGQVFKIVPGPPANNNCANATVAAIGSTNFNSANATTDGPDEPGCTFNGYSQIGNDIWYLFGAPCTGNATVSLCGANFNAKLAVYPGSGNCPTASGQYLACNDDFCGTAPQVTFPVTQGTAYRIRIGGFNGATGSGTMVISCAAPNPCPADCSQPPNGFVNIDDLFAVISSWGPCSGCPADCAQPPNGFVNIDDLFYVISNWGPCQ
jgi:glucose/arabinose dehydrogenase